MRLKFAIAFLVVTMMLVGSLLYENQHQRGELAKQSEKIDGQSDVIDMQWKIIVKQQQKIKKLEDMLAEPDKDTDALLAEIQ